MATELKLKEVFDVRGDSEVKVAADSLPPVTYRRLPIGAESMMAVKPVPKEGQPFGEAFLGAGYRAAVDAHGADVFGPWLKSLAEGTKGSTPCVLHCTAGKDRTGVAYGILLSLLGVPRDTILADYSLTNLSYDHLAKSFDKSGYPASYKSLLLAYPNALAETLDYIDTKYGSVEKYVESVGVTQAEMKALKSNLLE